MDIRVPRRGGAAHAGERLIRLVEGDLARGDPAGSRFDVLLVSAFPGDYAPVPGTLIGALLEAGVDVAELAESRESDLLASHGCWMSRRLPPGHAFSRILCFEPRPGVPPEELVASVFRALAPYLLLEGPEAVRHVATPLLRAGNQGLPQEAVLETLVRVAAKWDGAGLPLETLTICCHRGVPAPLAALFARLKAELEGAPSPAHLPPPPPAPAAAPAPAAPAAPAPAPGLQASSSFITGLSSVAQQPFKWDVFISYSHRNGDIASLVLRLLQEKRPRLRVFFDNAALHNGCYWQQELYAAIDDTRSVLAILTPDYLASKVCLEELHMSICRQREEGRTLLHLIYAASIERLPTYIKLLQYRDCREDDPAKVEAAVDDFLSFFFGARTEGPHGPPPLA
eukprot:tig00000140_g8460.t1